MSNGEENQTTLDDIAFALRRIGGRGNPDTMSDGSPGEMTGLEGLANSLAGDGLSSPVGEQLAAIDETLQQHVAVALGEIASALLDVAEAIREAGKANG